MRESQATIHRQWDLIFNIIWVLRGALGALGDSGSLRGLSWKAANFSPRHGSLPAHVGFSWFYTVSRLCPAQKPLQPNGGAVSIPHLSLKSPCRICTQSPGSRFLGCSPRDFGGRHTDLLPPIAFVSLPGLRAGPAVRQRDVLCCQPLAPGSADVHPPGAAGGRVPPFQPQGTGGGGGPWVGETGQFREPGPSTSLALAGH